MTLKKACPVTRQTSGSRSSGRCAVPGSPWCWTSSRYQGGSYAPHFRAYAVRIEGRAKEVSPGDMPRWLGDKLPVLEAHPASRELNLTVATALLPNFLEDDSLWRDCGVLNLWDAASDLTFANHLDSWAAVLEGKGGAPWTPPLVRGLLEVAPGDIRFAPGP